MAQIWRSQIISGAAIWAAQNGDGTPLVPTIGVITATENGCSFTYFGPVTYYRNFVLSGTASAWISITASPVTITALTVATEYTLQLSGDGTTVDAARNWGTLNPGSGGGTVSIAPTIVALAPTAVTTSTVRPRYQLTY